MPPDQHEDSVEPTGDVEMTATAQNTLETSLENTQEDTHNGEAEKNENADETALELVEEVAKPRITFANYLMSPIVTLLIGSSDQSILSAHQGLLTQSPYFKDICDAFVGDGSPRQIELPEYDIDTVGSFLEYLYTGEYFPKKLPGQRVLESDSAIPAVDDSGDQLLKHARIYTLADKFGVDGLKTLSSSKIHCVNSTAKGEIAYARYVYSFTNNDDITIRAPVASFWATRSHTLRAEAEAEFKALCLEHPQFGYDVLTRVLDGKLKRERNDKMHPATSSARKRARHSSGSRAE
ncbi:hypothetical protein FVEN_g4904 [Fusarium venenatum]|uniref:BTB domain-containing protein n=1 Tax=Fusarium venenatum TaxID=56646 RepID=A0A2L2SPP0_9HYPO|nr:uncharacterized protein FVRRES_11222 [Fusarium venenatum]KAG8357466.1 hypothetical protein FVEN_g4904 [Fusarium venenatum]KAH6977942.1 hypothetical protein EDB82DRAFT_502957 [Fusarium venenatum]CEI38531.1 unnamed protein product [Fusarium venenatum]